MAIRLLDHLKDPAGLLRELAQGYPESGKSAILLVATSNRRYFKEEEGLEEFSKEIDPEVAVASKCRDGVQRYLRSRTKMRRLFRDAGFHVYDEASPLLPTRIDHVPGLPKRDSDHAIAPFHIWLLGIQGTKQVPATMKEIRAWLKELDPARPSHAAARLLLKSLNAKTLSGVHWRTIAPDGPIAYGHNVGGRVFIIRSGRFGAYLPGADAPKVVFGPNEIFGELEVFKHRKEHDRRYVATVRAVAGQAADDECRALVLPAEPTVEALMARPMVLGNPMLGDLRTKSLEANLRYYPSKEAKPAFAFASPTHGTSTSVTPNFVSIVASILALALEADREKGLYSLDGRRVVYIDDIYKAPGLFLRLEGCNDSNRINGALNYLQAAGIVGLLRPVPASNKLKSMQEVWRLARERYSEALVAAQQLPPEKDETRLELAARLYKVDQAYSNVPGGERTFEQFLSNGNICIFLVEREMALRKFLTAPPQALFDENTRLIQAQNVACTKTILHWLLEMDKVAMQFWKRRIEVGEWGYDSLGLPLPQAARLKRRAKNN